MEVSLEKKGNRYEIWADKQYVSSIQSKPGEQPDAFLKRAKGEYDSYVQNLKRVKNGKQITPSSGSKSVFKTEI